MYFSKDKWIKQDIYAKQVILHIEMYPVVFSWYFSSDITVYIRPTFPTGVDV